MTLATGTSGPVAKSLEKSGQKSRPKAERKATKVAKVAAKVAKVAKAVARAAKVVKQLRLAKCPKPSLGPSMLQTSLPAEKMSDAVWGCRHSQDWVMPFAFFT